VDTSGSRLVLSSWLPPDVPLQSLAQLQHANLAAFGFQPGAAAGNSLAPYRLALTQDTVNTGADISGSPVLVGGVNVVGNRSDITADIDLSHLLNTALWDRYFFSTLPVAPTPAQLTDPAFRLANTRYRIHFTDTPDAAPLQPAAAHRRAAAHLLTEGAFNVNSTSVAAWEQVLSGLQRLAYNPESRTTTEVLGPGFSRHPVPLGGTAEFWRGYRQLTPAQIRDLATAIVAQVRLRGPFRSLSDFVNRRADPDLAVGLAGPLQAALNATPSVNPVAGLPTAANPVNTPNTNFRAGAPGNNQKRFLGSATATFGSPEYPASSRAFGAPGFITQADILTQIGPYLSARSDTFIVRAYGETRSPATGETGARAWCEAIVQRLPAYVNPGQPPETEPSALDATNVAFGRAFRVVSFRWLTPEDL
jgi:hypothetical protein